MTDRRSVVITGVGACSAAGPSSDDLARVLSSGEHALGPLPEPHHLLPPGFGGVVPEDRKLLRQLPGTRPLRPATMTRYTYLSTVGLGLVMRDAGLSAEPDDDEALRRSLFVGSYVNLPDMRKYVGMSHLVRDREASARGEYRIDDARIMAGMKRFTGFEFLRLMNNMPVGHGSIQARCKGPCNTFMGFCTAGLQAVGAGRRAVEDGLADTALCGGAGSAVVEHALLVKGHRGLLTTATDPADASRPFDRHAPGLVPGEGAGFVALEAAETAEARGAAVRARLLGEATGFQAPAEHPRGWPADHRAMAATVRAALDDAGVTPDEVDLLVPTAYGVPQMDALELAAYREVLGDRLDRVAILVTTPLIGMTEAAHGTLGLVAAVLALDGAVSTPSWSPRSPADGYPALPLPDVDRPRRALVTALAMEGSSAAVVVGRPA